MRAFTGHRLVIATHNPGKLKEFGSLLSPYIENIISAGDLGLPEPEETGTTFIANAILKATAAAKATESLALADDSGLCVTALHDEPGIYSARWAGPSKDFHPVMERIHKDLGSNPDRSAHFISVLALAWPDGHKEIFEGRVDGHIIWPPRGNEGHGYDPFFVPAGHKATFGEMNPEEKNALSHRAMAVRKLVSYLRKDLPS